MRTYKFRAWYKPQLEKGIVQKFIQKEIDYKLYFVAENDDEVRYEFYIPFIDDDWLVEQYIGLEDKDGDEIYEGDILGEYNPITEEFDVIFTVIYDKDSAAYKVKGSRGDEYEIDESLKTMEVIGNIHEKEKRV